MHPDFESVIGLEVHCQLATESKIFSASPAKPRGGKSVSEEQPNALASPIDAGHPGTLPVLNKKVVEFAVMAGLATNSRINRRNIFARKHYFYPDQPKGYQISQYESPICEHGWLDIPLPGGASKKITLQRIHMEEDAGKNIHASGYSLVNLNRAGVPLIEIVSGPDMRTAVEAGAYLRALHAIVTYLGICDGNMQEGNFRCDANVSVRLRGAAVLGTRVEIKNLNSFRFIEKAIDFEIDRQIALIQSGGAVVQETRLYDSQKNLTQPMRSKEEAMDYRYFPDPDLPPVIVEESWIEEIRARLPELPAQRRGRYVAEWGLSVEDAGVITGSKALAVFFEESVARAAALGLESKAGAKSAANFLSGEVSRLAKEEGIEVDQSHLRPEHVAQVAKLALEGVVSSTGAKQALATAWKTGEAVERIVESAGLRQVSDLGALEPLVDAVIARFPSQAEEFRSGREKILGFFVGQIMKESGGKANPALLQELVRKRLGK